MSSSTSSKRQRNTSKRSTQTPHASSFETLSTQAKITFPITGQAESEIPLSPLSSLSISAAYESLYGQLSQLAATDFDSIVFVGITQLGHAFGNRLRSKFEQAGVSIPVGLLDISLFRDDIHKHHYVSVGKSIVPFSIDQKIVVLIDVYMNTGRSARAALNALSDYGCPKRIDIGVLFFNLGLEMPVFPRFCGQAFQLPTDQHFHVSLLEVDGEDTIKLEPFVA